MITAAGPAGTATELFDQGKKLLLEEKYKEAAEAFDLVLKGEPEGRLAPMALVQAGMAYEGLADHDTALARYRQVIDKFPKDELVKLAWLRSSRLLVRAERWGELGAAADALLARADLTNAETIEAEGAKSLSIVEAGGDLEQASRQAEHARTIMEKYHIGESGHITDEVAQVFFAIGEVRRAESEKLKFDPMPPNFAEAFEQRAQGLLRAQSAFTDAMRTTDAYWATWAGYRVGQLYQQLHRDVMVIKTPDNFKTPRQKQMFEGAMRLRYRILLEKGLKMMDATVRMNERVSETNGWGAKAKASRAELQKSLDETNIALKKLPISEEDLQKFLDDLSAKRAAAKP